MTRGNSRERWNHTSQLMAMLANCNRDPKRRSTPYRAEDFHPFERSSSRRSGRGRTLDADTARRLGRMFRRNK